MGEYQRENYLKRNPELEKWINTCIICNTKGYKPEMPNHTVDGVFNNGHFQVQRFFDPLRVNELNICEQCEAFAKRI